MAALTGLSPGWYLDPDDQQTRRYWNGSRWTEARLPVKPGGDTPDYGSYVLAALLPIVGVVLAIVQFARGNIGPGFAVLLTSLVGGVIAMNLWMVG